ncbi:MAG: hypothetical protein ABSC18_17490, partial [Verrucomicrobiota bacterium]
MKSNIFPSSTAAPERRGRWLPAADVLLHSTVRLNPSEWQPVTTPPVPGGLYNSVTLPMTDTASFFRRVH